MGRVRTGVTVIEGNCPPFSPGVPSRQGPKRTWVTTAVLRQHPLDLEPGTP